MMAVPPAILDRMNLRAGTVVDLEINEERLMVKPQAKRRYTLGELLAQCEAEAPITEGEREWIDGAPVGRELL